MRDKISGQITATRGSDNIEVELPHGTQKHHVHVEFEGTRHPSCNPHHHHHEDRLEWFLVSYANRLYLQINWKIQSESRTIRWKIG